MIPAFVFLPGHTLAKLATLPSGSIHCCVTSPPYWGLRDYKIPPVHWDAIDYAPMPGLPPVHVDAMDCCLGLEKTPEAFVGHIVQVFREVWRALRDDGTLWLNFGDSYSNIGKWGVQSGGKNYTSAEGNMPRVRRGLDCDPKRGRYANGQPKHFATGLKPKDLIGIPWRVAFALQADGWWLRMDNIWCLSGGTWLYVYTEASGECVMTVKDLFRIRHRPGTMLWNGHAWTPLLGMSQSPRRGNELEIVLRSGERISCTPTHQFPTCRGLLSASEIKVGDCLQRCHLPNTFSPKDCAIDRDAAWFAGLYLAEGSRAGDTIQISGHTKEHRRWEQVLSTVRKFGGSATRTISGNTMNIRVYGRLLNAIVDDLVSGRTAHDKCFSPQVWRYSNTFVEAMLRGYLEGDGCYEEKNKRWRLGFCRNYNLERDLRTACARLGYHLTLKLSKVRYNGGFVPTFRGEIRETRSGHFNQKQPEEVVEIRKARCREVYDIGVSDPHVFALASGIMTHNSKPNPMPESVTDRPTKAHEYLFLMAKSDRYFYDAEAVREPQSETTFDRFKNGCTRKQSNKHVGTAGECLAGNKTETAILPNGRNKRSVWTIPSAPFKGAHFATFPPKLVEPCILAGTSARGCCSICGSPWARVVEKIKGSPDSFNGSDFRNGKKFQSASELSAVGQSERTAESKTIGWKPNCSCNAETIPCTVLDPFLGSGTTAQVALELGRNAVGIDISEEYAMLIGARTNVTPALPLA